MIKASLPALPADLYPFKGSHLDVGGGRLHYLDEGSGEPIVMLHGNPTWSFYYRRLVVGLRNTHRVIAPDHIGCGLSDKPDDAHYEYSLERRVKDIGTLLDHLGIESNVTLVLHDWGGMIGMVWAARHSDRVKRIVLMNTSAFRLPSGKKLPWQLWITRKTWLGAFFTRAFNAFCLGAALLCVTRRPLPADVRAAYLAPYDSWANRIAVLRFVQDIPLRPGDRGFELIVEVEEAFDRFARIPMLICWGMKDFVFDHHFLEEWERRCPHARVHRFEKSGHYILEEEPEEILSLVRTFLADE